LECINDGATHAQLAQSHGLCRLHAQQAALVERDELGMLLGNSIIYETLVQLVLQQVGATRGLLATDKRPSTLRTHLWQLFGIPLPRRAADPARLLIPRGRCRVCETGIYVSEYYTKVLASMLAQEQYRALYEESDGICLSHLRAMLRSAEQGPGLDYVMTATDARLGALKDRLEQIAQQQGALQDTDNEGAVIREAIAFFTGSTFDDDVAMSRFAREL